MKIRLWFQMKINKNAKNNQSKAKTADWKLMIAGDSEVMINLS